MRIKPLSLCLSLILAAAPSVYATTAVPSADTKTTASYAAAQLNVTSVPFGKLPDGKQAHLYTLTNANGIEVQATDFGGILTAIKTPDKNGKLGDIILGFDNLDAYLSSTAHFGAMVGRYGNRIGKGQFTIDGKTYQLTLNDGTNHLHGGSKAFEHYLWKAKPFKTARSVGLTLTHFSPDGDQGYPGNLQVTVVYELTNANEFTITYKAKTDKPTHINMTQHPYFNLAGSGDILSHELMINGDHYTPVDATLIPTGEIAPVKGSAFDFTTSHPIGQMIGQDHEQLKNGKGYDHNWVLNKKSDSEWGLDARFYEPVSGRVLEIYSDEPGLQFYSGNFLDGKVEGKGVKFVFRGAVCLEPQHYPDTPNKPNFPSTLVQPGTEYNNKFTMRFLVKK